MINVIAGFRLWAATRDKSVPYPCHRPGGAGFWTPAQVATCFRRWPHSLGWRKKAAAAGVLPASMAIPDQGLADELVLWSRPNSASLELIRAYEAGELGIGAGFY